MPETAKQVEPAGRAIRDRMLAALEGRAEPVRVSVLYRLGLLLVAVVMVLLPALYVGLIGLACYGLYYHATEHLSILSHAGSSRWAILVYVGPLVAGAILVFFMVKPLFARRAREQAPRKLSPGREPFLHEFVARLCRAVGAPVPREIHVDCDLNASASLRRGLLSFFGRDLVLTIGAPLVAGLGARNFAGVLAHEFGHFSQAAGMRLTYVIRSVSGWFARIVYERDSWDESLIRWSKEYDIRIGVVFYIARFFVWVTRKVLWVLMAVGHVISCFMLRQMEYDADRYEARLAGSGSFEATMRRLTELGVAASGAHADLGDFWAEGRLPDDFAALVLANVPQIPEQIRREHIDRMTDCKTGFLDTHPCATDRVARARREDCRGMFHVEVPASALFSDFGTLSKELSFDYYRQLIGRKVKRQDLYPVAELLGRQEGAIEGGKALARYYQGVLSALRPVSMPAGPIAPPGDPDRAVRELTAARERMLAAVPKYKSLLDEYDEADTTALQATIAEALIGAGFKLPAGSFDLPDLEPKGVRQALRSARDQTTRLEGDMGSFEAHAGGRLFLALGLLMTPDVASRVEGGHELAQEVLGLRPVEELMRVRMPGLLAVRNRLQSLGTLAEQVEDSQVDEKLYRKLMSASRHLNAEIHDFRVAFEDTPYPFEHAKKGITIARFLVDKLPANKSIGANLEAAEQLIDRAHSLYYRVLGQLVLAAEKAEAAVGLEPLPEPPQEEPPGSP